MKNTIRYELGQFIQNKADIYNFISQKYLVADEVKRIYCTTYQPMMNNNGTPLDFYEFYIFLTKKKIISIEKKPNNLDLKMCCNYSDIHEHHVVRRHGECHKIDFHKPNGIVGVYVLVSDDNWVDEIVHESEKYH